MKWKSNSWTVFIGSTPSFFEFMYMLLQNNCKISGVTNGLKEKKGKKPCKTACNGKREERDKGMGEGVNG